MTDSQESRAGKAGNQQDVEIVFQGENHWKVRIMFSSREAVDREMVERLRSAKNLIAKQHNVPVELLELTEILERNPSRKGFAITISIGKILVERGQPVLSFRQMETPNGIVIEDMVAELDISYLDDANELVTPERLSHLLVQKDLDPGLCDQVAIKEAVKKVVETKSAVRGLVVARGILPEEGENARLELNTCLDLSGNETITGKFEDRKVKKSNVLCRKTFPTRGKQPGRNVFGKEIPSLYGLDIDLVDGEGTSLTDHGDGLVATQDGVAHISVDYRTIYTETGEERFPETVRISVRPILRLQGEDVGDLIVAESVEVDGSIGDGAAVTTQGEFYMSGDLETGAVIRAGSDVRINGRIKGGEIVSDRSVRSSGEVMNTVIIAGHHVELEGMVEGASITGHVVKLNESRGSSIVADSRVEMERAGHDIKGRATSIQVGRMDFYLDKVKSNKKTISDLGSYLVRICDLFGSENVLRLNQSNIQYILVQHLKSLRQAGNNGVKESTVQSMKKLLEEVAPLRNIIAQKSREIDLYKEKAKEQSATPPIIIISEMTSDPVTVSLNGKRAVVGPLARPSTITTSPDGDVKTLPLNSSSENSAGPE